MSKTYVLSPSKKFLDIFGTFFRHFSDIFSNILSTVDIPFFWAVQRFARYNFMCFVRFLDMFAFFFVGKWGQKNPPGLGSPHLPEVKNFVRFCPALTLTRTD